MNQVLDPKENYLAQFAQTAPSQEPSWVAPLRKAAISRFGELGFPRRVDEEWRFTHVAPLTEVSFQPAAATAPHITQDRLAPFTFGDTQTNRLVFLNGHYMPELSALNSLPAGVEVSSLAEAFAANTGVLEPNLARYAQFENAAFVALNTAFLQDGAVVSLPRNVVVEQPIHLLFASTAPQGASVSHPRVLVIAGENSQATIVESYVGLSEDVYFTNAVTEVIVHPNAQIDHYKIQRESLQAFHIATMQVQMARAGVFASHSIALGGRFVRNDVNAVLGGEGIECTLNGLSIANGKRLIDNHTSIDHAMPHCNSHEVYKVILDDRARGVFNGKIFVREDAQKTDAKQTNKTLLLSDDAQINTKPQLEIFADDVRCTHGATVGQLDANALFYLRTRGIGEAEARRLLIYAFASDIVSRIKVEPVRRQLDAILLASLPQV